MFCVSGFAAGKKSFFMLFPKLYGEWLHLFSLVLLMFCALINNRMFKITYF
jgi:hypothetical protein